MHYKIYNMFTHWVLFMTLTSLAIASDNSTQTPDVDTYWSKAGNSHAIQSGPTLVFIGISRNNTRSYTCHSINKTNPSQNVTVETVGINVVHPAKITKFGVQPSVATENQTFIITCMIEGNPSPTWEIRHNLTHDVVYRSHDQGGAVQTVRANCGDDGAYVCTGYNDLNHGVNVTEGQAVDVNCSPRLDPNSHYPLVRQALVGTEVHFRIFVIGFPAPTFSWSRDDGEPMRNVIVRNRQREAAIQFKSVHISDFGNYTLVMNNTFGSSSVECALLPSPYEPPQPPANLTFNNVTSDSVILNWISGYDMGGNMSFVINQWTAWGWEKIRQLYEPYTDHGAGQGLSYNLTGLDKNTNYTLALTRPVVMIRQLYEPYTDHGNGQIMSYNLTGLDENANYALAMVATKTNGMNVTPQSSHSNIIMFTTKVGDHPPYASSPHHDRVPAGVIIAIAVVSATIALLQAF